MCYPNRLIYVIFCSDGVISSAVASVDNGHVNISWTTDDENVCEYKIIIDKNVIARDITGNSVSIENFEIVPCKQHVVSVVSVTRSGRQGLAETTYFEKGKSLLTMF